jgi:PAS domain S-box-containing protein
MEQALTRAMADREPFTLDYRLRGADGTYRWAIDAGRPLVDERGRPTGYIGSVIDVHERARTEVALRESEARFRALFDSIDEGYCLAEMILDAEGRPTDYRFLETNPIFESMTGLEGAVGRTARELVPGLEQSWIDTYGRVALEGEAMRFESSSEAMGRTFDVFATPVEPRGRFALVFTDVTARRRAEAALRESEAAERRARRRAELLAEIVGELEAAEGAEARAARLAGMLTPRVADHAAVRVAGDGPGPDAPRAAHSVVTLPLDTGGSRSARLVLSLTDPARPPYGADDMPFLTDLAGRAGVLLASARLHDEERRIALSLQRALLPERLLLHPAIEVAARYAAAGDALEVGGDWYETLPLPDGRIGIAVGDVVGHGLEAAATMGRLRTALAALAPHAPAPGLLLSRLQQFADGPNGTDFATVGFAALDPRTGAVEYAYAGHPPMLVLPPGGPASWLEGGRSMPLCRPGSGRDRAQAAATLTPGSVLLLYTDGLVERRQESMDVGLERLREAAEDCRDAPVDEMCDRIVEAMIRATGNSDDAVLVCLRLLPVTADGPGPA